MIDYIESEDYDTPSGTPFMVSDDDDDRKEGEGEGEGGGGTRIEFEGEQSQSRRSRTRQERRSKVGMAVIFNKAPLEGEVPQWDYTLRLNYTYGVSQFEEQVSYFYNASVFYSTRADKVKGLVVEIELVQSDGAFPRQPSIQAGVPG